MRTVFLTILVAATTTCGVAALVASPQAPTNASSDPLKEMPYSAKRTVTKVESLPDGTTVTHTFKSLVWRDAEGRERQEDIHLAPGVEETRSVNVRDPIAHVHFFWNVGNVEKEVMVTHLPTPVSAPQGKSKAEGARIRQYAAGDPNFVVLPPTYINGVYATGIRITDVIPAGKESDDHDIKVICESWKSPDLKVTVREICDDPRTGKTTLELTDIDRSNPDLALFQVPEGYRMQDITPVGATPSNLEH